MKPPALPSLVIAGLLAGLAGCLSVPDGPTPQCNSTSDCDHADGEVCEEGVCWGNPPAGPFAAVISPPSSRHDLVPLELAQVAIDQAGHLGDLALDAPVALSGKVVEFCPPPMTDCDTGSLSATVTVTRSSKFQGGPGFAAVADVAAGGAFSLPVPRTRSNDDMYVVTVVPDGGRIAGTVRSPAEQVPPRRLQLGATDSATTNRIELGGADLPVISGMLADSLGQGLVGYRVVALGRWSPDEPITEVSSVDFTDGNGTYSLTLSDDLFGTVEVVARPPAGPAAPTVHLTNIDASKSVQRNAIAPANLGSAIKLGVKLTGLSHTGEVVAVSGATVSVAGALTNTLTTYTAGDQQVTDKNGAAQLQLLGGSGIVGSYKISITPPAGSELGVIYSQDLAVVPDTTVPFRLGARISLHGTVTDAAGHLLTGVAVTARPSLRFLWTLDADQQAFVAGVPAATTATADDGSFQLRVDAKITTTWGEYDLVIEPQPTADAPTFVRTTQVERTAAAVQEVGTTTLPDAAFVHGHITTPDGDPVEAAEIKLYQVSTQLGLCAEVAHAPTSCPIPASLQGRNTSDADGAVRLALPRP